MPKRVVKRHANVSRGAALKASEKRRAPSKYPCAAQLRSVSPYEYNQHDYIASLIGLLTNPVHRVDSAYADKGFR